MYSTPQIRYFMLQLWNVLFIKYYIVNYELLGRNFYSVLLFR